MTTATEMIVNGSFAVIVNPPVWGNCMAWWREYWGTVTDPPGEWTLMAADSAVHNGGSYSLRITAATAGAKNGDAYQVIEVVPGQSLTLSFDNRGDGTYSGRFAVYDVTNFVFVEINGRKGAITIGNTAAAWASYSYTFLVPAACYQIQVRLYAPAIGAGINKITWFDNVSLREVHAQLPIIRGFGDTFAAMEPFPLTDARMPHGAGRGESQQVVLPGGRTYDYGRVGIAPEVLGQTIEIRGQWIASTVAEMQAKASALNALLGVRSKLWRDYGTGLHPQWRYARCTEVSGEFTPRDQLYYAEFLLAFEADSGPWYGQDRTQMTALGVGLTTTIVCVNYGNAPITNAVLTITAGVSDITDLSVVHHVEIASAVAAGYTYWMYSGTIVATQSLAVDAGDSSCTNAGSDDYAHLELVPAGGAQYHRVLSWLYLVPGYNDLEIIRVGGDATATAELSYCEGWY